MIFRELPLSHGEPQIGGIRPGPGTGHTSLTAADVVTAAERLARIRDDQDIDAILSRYERAADELERRGDELAETVREMAG